MFGLNNTYVVEPEFVWLVTGSATYPNEKAAKILARRNAGIGDLLVAPADKIENTPFKWVEDKETFLRVSRGRSIYSFGEDVTQTDGRITSSIGGISTPETSLLYSYSSLTASEDAVKRNVYKYLCDEYNDMLSKGAPVPRTVSTSMQAQGQPTTVIALALIVPKKINA